jgi:hypothetical protein
MPSDKTTSGFDLSAGAGPSQRSEWPTLSQSSPVKNSTDRPSKQSRLMTSYFGGGSSSQGGASQEVRTTSYGLLLLLLTGPCPLTAYLALCESFDAVNDTILVRPHRDASSNR